MKPAPLAIALALACGIAAAQMTAPGHLPETLRLETTTPMVAPGGIAQLDLSVPASAVGRPVVLFLGLTTGPTTLPGGGSLPIGAPLAPVHVGVAPNRRVAYAIAVPRAPGLIGTDLYFAAVLPDQLGGVPRRSNPVVVRIGQEDAPLHR